MSEGKETNESETNPKSGKGKGQEVRIVVDKSKQMEDLEKQLAKATKEREKAIEDLAAKEAELKTAKEEKTAVEEDKGDLQAKLELIAEREYAKKKEAIIAQAENVFKDPKTGELDEEKLKEIKAKLEDPEKGPENLRMTEYMLTHLDSMLKKGSEEAKKLAEEKTKKAAEKKKAETKAGTEGGDKATGQTPLTGEQTTTEGEGGEAESWDSHYAMIADLRKRARNSKEPEKQAEAQAILNELWKKWAKEVKKDYMQGRLSFEEEKQKKIKEMQKSGAA